MNKQKNISEAAENIIKNKRQRKDSSDISSYDSDDERKIDNMTNEDIRSNATQKYIETELLERINKYFKIDTLIKDKQKEVRDMTRELKKQKQEMEKYIIGYLEEIDEEYIKVSGKCKLMRATKTTKGAINNKNICTSIANGMSKENIKLDDGKFNSLLTSILEFIDSNRPTKTKQILKQVKNKKGDKSENEDNDEDEDIPKY